MSEELKPCPFCGSAVYNHYKTWLGHYIINCHSTCGVSMMTHCTPEGTKKVAFKAWNTRKGDSNASRT